VTSYWGGIYAGICLQLTADMEEGQAGYIQLSEHDVKALRRMLKKVEMWPDLLETPY
jgi:hypothetical protein